MCWRSRRHAAARFPLSVAQQTRGRPTHRLWGSARVGSDSGRRGTIAGCPRAPSIRAVTRPAPLLGRDGPFRDLVGVNPRYDARSLLTQGALVDDDAVDRFFVVHGIVLPVLVALAVSALAWGARRSAARGARS